MLKQMELALAYGCPDSVESESLVEYIHHNRDLNARQINTLGNDISLKTCSLYETSSQAPSYARRLQAETAPTYRLTDGDEV